MVNSPGGIAAPGSNQNANTGFFGPATGGDGAPAFRPQVIADLPVGIQGNDYIALKEIGSQVKGWPVGCTWLMYPGNNTLTNGNIFYDLLYIPAPSLLTGCRFALNVTGNYVSAGYNGIALYSVNLLTGQLIQIAATTNSTTIWAGSNTWNTINFSSAINVVEGVYCTALLYQRSSETTAPAINCLILDHASYCTFDFPNNIKLCGTSPGTSLPASINFSSINNNASHNYIYVF